MKGGEGRGGESARALEGRGLAGRINRERGSKIALQ